MPSNLGNYNKCGVYMIKNLINGKFYIGSSLNIGKRWSEHNRSLETGSHHSIFLQRSYDKYGKNYFIFGILEECIDLAIKEQYYINLLNPEYNLSKFAYGGMRGKNLTSEHIEKIRKANLGRKPSQLAISRSRAVNKSRDYGRTFFINSVMKRQKAIIVWLDYLTPLLFNNKNEVIDFFKLENRNKTYVNDCCRGRHKLNGLKAEYA